MHWYCRFFLGRRCDDDARQISRWAKCAGSAGRWKRNLIAKCVRAGKAHDDWSVSPVVRQTLAHWAYELTEADYEEYAEQVRGGKATSFVPQYTMAHVVENDGGGDGSGDGSDAIADAKKRAEQSSSRDERRKKRSRS